LDELEQQTAPEYQEPTLVDTPADTPPVQGEPTQPAEAVDYQKRYQDLQSWATKVHLENLTLKNQTLLAGHAQNGQLASPDAEDGYYEDDPVEIAKQALASSTRIEKRFEQADLERNVSEMVGIIGMSVQAANAELGQSFAVKDVADSLMAKGFRLDGKSNQEIAAAFDAEVRVLTLGKIMVGAKPKPAPDTLQSGSPALISDAPVVAGAEESAWSIYQRTK